MSHNFFIKLLSNIIILTIIFEYDLCTYIWTPSQLFGDPAYLSTAVGAPYPVTAPLLQEQYLDN